ncbi:MAG: hypothetical protein R3246_09505, partial [Acidimicrobiia bacterium]|nr:hypothetical protein [Acidimicrobiia bacterium]
MRPVRTTVVAALTALGIGLVGFAPASGSMPPSDHASCGEPRWMVHLGWACPIDSGGFEVILPDGSTYVTHGGDPVPAHSRRHIEAGSKNPECADARSEFHSQVIYVHPADQPSRFGQLLPDVRAMVKLANGLVFSDARDFGRKRKIRVACVGGEMQVLQAQLPTVNEDSNVWTVVWDLRAQGFTSPLAKYWIFYDGRPPNAPAGTALGRRGDDGADPDNPHNIGPDYAVTWGLGVRSGGAATMLHELGHTLGAVQNAAPNSSGAGHCNDGHDIMCYDDSGPFADYSRDRCREVAFDCGHDDYFHPKPGKKNYLRRAWNLGS